MSKCLCEDSNGDPCQEEMTQQEKAQDGMCWNCADNVWNEIRSGMTDHEYCWYHPVSEVVNNV